jgi:hypothetical protein
MSDYVVGDWVRLSRIALSLGELCQSVRDAERAGANTRGRFEVVGVAVDPRVDGAVPVLRVRSREGVTFTVLEADVVPA